MNAKNFKNAPKVISFTLFFSFFFLFYSFIYELYQIKTYENFEIVLIQNSLRYLLLGFPFIYFLFQLKKISNNIVHDQFFTIDTAKRFQKIAFSVFSLNIFCISNTISLIFVPVYIMTRSTNDNLSGTIETINYIGDYTIEIFSSFLSPLIPFIVIWVLSYFFYLIYKTISVSVTMKNELDDTI